MQRAVGTVLVVVLVVLAGCSGVFGGDGGGESTPTVTPMTVPTDEPTPTPVPQLAPGLTGQGIENASALVAAHSSFLQNRSFTERSNSTGLGPNGSVLVDTTSTLHVGSGDEGIYAVTERNSSEGYSPYPETLAARTEVWSNDGRTLWNRTYANGTTRYDRLDSSSQTRFGAAGAGLRYRLEWFTTDTTSVTERQRNGSTLYLVRGKTRTEQTFANGNTSLRMLVDRRGVIHSYRTVQQLSGNENLTRVVSTTRFSAIGATDVPDRPSWADTALNRTTSVPSRTPSSANATASMATTTSGSTTARNATVSTETTSLDISS
ncbi:MULTISPECIES: hypothetical protein [Halococcus]|uniref:Lipoprotein n=1 Tax=Halococcus salifodinae DSM 8989 TaxID=1227456 RepID=M0NC57_9EURY|nr:MULTISPECIES: hypothetical protein [Halococcus]EMA55527.1 hypothetical protein C450_02134 [Halococcus salifodinae DSM 8989]